MECSSYFRALLQVDRLLTVQDIMALNRDHFEGTPYDMTQGLQGKCPV
jgi:dipeptidase